MHAAAVCGHSLRSPVKRRDDLAVSRWRAAWPAQLRRARPSQMYFEATTKVTLWFKQWHVSGYPLYLLSCLGLVVLCLLQEALSMYRADYYKREFAVGGAALDPLLGGSKPPAPALRARVALSGLYALNVATAYLLMLAVMTFNAGYFVAIVAGLALGHFLFLRPHSAASSEACCAQPLE